MFLFSKPKDSDVEGDRAGKLRLFLIIGGALLGVILLLFGSGALQSEEETPIEEATVSYSDSELRAYQSQLEKRIETLCESVSGVGNATVVVMLESGFEDIYATEEKDGDEQYVILGSGSNASALFLTRAMPQISGLGIVCTGGENPTVQRELTALLCATFHISSNRVYVTSSQT